jgi:hypothetical protein
MAKSAAEKKAEKEAVELEKLQVEAIELGVNVPEGSSAAEIKELIKAGTKNLGGKKPAKNASVCDVVDANGVIRSYSVKVHGDDFLKLAEEFAGKVDGRKVVAKA